MGGVSCVCVGGVAAWVCGVSVLGCDLCVVGCVSVCRVAVGGVAGEPYNVYND